MTINEALAFRKERAENVAKCYKHENLSTCMERIVKAEVHRLVVVDSEEHVIGVLSLSDLLNYIVMRPTKLDHSIPSGNASLPSPEGSGRFSLELVLPVRWTQCRCWLLAKHFYIVYVLLSLIVCATRISADEDFLLVFVLFFCLSIVYSVQRY